jgi:hypothetical protein
MTHTGCEMSGRFHIKIDYGTEQEFGPGGVSYVPLPGHDSRGCWKEPICCNRTLQV